MEGRVSEYGLPKTDARDIRFSRLGYAAPDRAKVGQSDPVCVCRMHFPAEMSMGRLHFLLECTSTLVSRDAPMPGQKPQMAHALSEPAIANQRTISFFHPTL